MQLMIWMVENLEVLVLGSNFQKVHEMIVEEVQTAEDMVVGVTEDMNQKPSVLIAMDMGIGPEIVQRKGIKENVTLVENLVIKCEIAQQNEEEKVLLGEVVPGVAVEVPVEIETEVVPGVAVEVTALTSKTEAQSRVEAVAVVHLNLQVIVVLINMQEVRAQGLPAEVGALLLDTIKVEVIADKSITSIWDLSSEVQDHLICGASPTFP